MLVSFAARVVSARGKARFWRHRHGGETGMLNQHQDVIKRRGEGVEESGGVMAAAPGIANLCDVNEGVA